MTSKDTTITLMRLEPKPEVRSVVYTVDMPVALRDALSSKGKDYQSVELFGLRENLRCWLDFAVEMRPIPLKGSCERWLVAMRPVDARRLRNVVALWFEKRFEGRQQEPAYRRVRELLTPALFEGCMHQETLRLFDEDGAPSSDAGDLAFSVFSAQVADTLVGRPLCVNGVDLTFARVSRGTGSACELLSNVQWNHDSPYAVALKFSVQTTPFGRKSYVNVDASIKRFIRGVWADRMFMSKDVVALVRARGDALREVPYGYREEDGIVWDAFARENFESFGIGKLPPIDEYLGRIADFARDDATPQILSPYGTSTSWAEKPAVDLGLPLVDKAVLFEQVAQALENFATPSAPMTSEKLANLRPRHVDATAAMYEENPDEAARLHAQWAHANRARLAACTGRNAITLQILAAQGHDEVVDCVCRAIADFLGEELCVDGVTVRVECVDADSILGPLPVGKSGDIAASARIRWRAIERCLPAVSELTGCIVVLPGEAAFREAGADPKQAIRIGLARSGRLSQFIVPGERDDASLQHRSAAAVRDLMRQMGFMFEFKEVAGEGFDSTMPVLGASVYRQFVRGRRGNIAFPLMVGIEPQGGQVWVKCPLFDGKKPAYWQALLELARLSSDDGFMKKLPQDPGVDLRALVDAAKRAATRETLLLVHAYGCIRSWRYWPGISDSGLAGGVFTYGPRGAAVPFEQGDSRLAIMRVRSGANGEVPDYYTSVGSFDEKTGMERRSTKQGLFPMGGYVYALAGRPNDASYIGSQKVSKFAAPSRRFAEKTLTEYCLLTPGTEADQLRYARIAEAHRGKMVQLLDADRKANLPAPLHLAEQVGEYVWTGDR